MKVSFFIDRPVFSIVVSILIVILGFIGLTMLPIDQYPQITPPVVKISATYPGASALTVAQAVATPIEQQLNGTPGMIYMESSSSNSGSFSATVTFDIGTDPELAAVDIQNRIKLAESRLPAEVVQNGINVERQSPSQLMTVCLTSSDPKFDEIYLSNFATLNVLDLIRRVPGVGRVSNVGSRYYAMQIWVQPDKLASYGLTIADLQNSLKDQNRESAAGEFGKAPMIGIDVTTPISTQGRLSTVGQFEEIVLRANPDGSLIRLRDVARISLEAQSYNTESGINGENAAVMGIYMLPGANAVEVADNVKAMMDLEIEGSDCVIMDEVVARYYINLDNNKGKFKVLDETLADEEYAVAFRKGDDALSNKVNEILGEMKEDGRLSKIAEDWFATDATLIK
jgi:multidrug efflux pump subunit AcrB